MRQSRWKHRHSVFKLGFCGLLFSLMLCCIGYVAPAWQNTGGLWIYPDFVQSLPDWLQAVRAAATMNVAGLVACVVVEVYQDMVCRRSSPPADNWLVEVLAVVAGLSGLVAAVIFGVLAHVRYPPGQGPFGPCSKPLFWAWGLQLVGGLVAVLSSAVLAHSRAKNKGRSERRMQVVAFRRKAPVGLNPYFVSRSASTVRVAPPAAVSVQTDSQA